MRLVSRSNLLQNCKKCGRKKWVKTGEWERKDSHLVRVWQCTGTLGCNHKQSEGSPFGASAPVKPAILYFDIESAPHSVLVWDMYVPSKRISINNLVKECFMICWAAGWVDEEEPFQRIISRCIHSWDALQADDAPILKDLFDMLERADYVVGHNSDNFDIKLANWRFKVNGMGMPYLYKQIDTFKLSRKYYKPPSHGLNFLAPSMGGEEKMHMTFDDWKEITLRGDPLRLLAMETYCRADVRNGILMYRDMVKDIEASGRKVYK